MAIRCVSLIFLVGLVAGNKVWSPDDYPNPTTNLQSCGRQDVRSWICDPDGLLTYESANFVEGTIAKVAVPEQPYASSPCGEAGLHGYQVAVALMREFHISAGVSAADEAEAFARHLHDSWGVGLKSCDNGVLLLLSVENRQIYISTGSSAAVVLSDSVLDVIIENMRPELRAAKYGEAVEKGVVELGLALAGKPIPPKESKDEGSWTPMAIFLAATAGMVGIVTYLSTRQARQYKAAASHLERLKADQRAALDGKYVSRACPICLEEFTVPQATTAEAAARELKPMSGELSSETAPLLAAEMAMDGGASTSSSAGASGSTQAAGSASAGAERPGPQHAQRAQQQRKPLVLGCGHGFCEACIAEWLKKKVNCPICRQTIGPESSRPQPPPSMDGQRRPQSHDVMPELAFRLHMLRRRYPTFITTSMVDSWQGDLTAGRELSAAALRDFQLRDPALRRETEHRGSGGSSSSFGGGHSSGGRGGSW